MHSYFFGRYLGDSNIGIVHRNLLYDTTHKSLVWDSLSGIEIDSYKSRILDGALMGSGTKMKLYELVSQIARGSVSIFWY